MRGKRLDAAKRKIRQSHCGVGHIRRARSRRVGRVIGQSPRPGAIKRIRFPIRLVVGAAPVDATVARSRYAPFPPPASRSFGHGPKCLRGLLVGDTRERDEARRGQRGLFDRRVRVPSRRRRSQRAATRGCRRGSLRATSTVSSSASARLSCGRSFAAASADEHVPALECPLECCVRVAGRARSSLLPRGRSGEVSLERYGLPVNLG